MGQHFATIIVVVGTFTGALILSYVYLDASAASIIMVTLLPLGAVPTLIRSSFSISMADETTLSNEEANHVNMQLCVFHRM